MPAAAAVRDWRAAAASLQRLDILTATEERGLQQCEMRLAKLGDEAVESHLASETLLIDLRRRGGCNEASAEAVKAINHTS